MHEPHRTVSTWMVKATTFSLVIAFVAIASLLYGAQMQLTVMSTTTESTVSAEQELPAPIFPPTDQTPQLVILTPQSWMSPTPYPTSKPYATDAPIPDCLPGIATPGAVCVAYPPKPTAMIETPVPLCETPVPVGSRCLWRR